MCIGMGRWRIGLALVCVTITLRYRRLSRFGAEDVVSCMARVPSERMNETTAWQAWLIPYVV